MPDERIDSHAHVFLSSLPMAVARRYSPTTNAPLGAYLDALDRHGITHGVLIQPSFLGTDNSYLIASLRAAPGRLRGICVVDPAISDEDLGELTDAGVVGVRLNLLGRATPDLRASHWPAFVERLVRRNWQIEIQQHAGLAIEPVAQLLGMGATVVLDHFALPDATLGAADPDWRKLLALGTNGRLRVKISGAYRNGANGGRVARDCFPVLRDTLGMERLMWGSDWPHTQFEAVATYETAYRLLLDLALSDLERAQLLAAPAHLFGFS